ncbi:hypothetical protein AUJ84_01960 [Candidatus Pacearchaeota archaeon CG1_02_32_132]|nr:MAG: hypothetical protein AUJ84_01960 [Candidatus Pacearchaeota archaeon CG1_02_32_132]
MDEKFKELEQCRACGSKSLVSYLDLGKTPLANSLIMKEDVGTEEVFPLNVLLCRDCFFSQLSIVVNPEKMFRNYFFVSSISNTFRKHCEELAFQLNDSGIFEDNNLIVDIASNDGTLLKPFKEKGNRILGVDPALNIAKIANDERIETIPEYWTPELAKKIREKYGTAKVITAFNVFAHVDDIHSFVESAKLLLDKEGYFIIESPHILPLINNTEFDTIYHEHLSYLLVKPLISVMNSHGFRIAKIEEHNIHGGSIRMFMKHIESEETSDETVRAILEKEEKQGLYSFDTYLSFKEKVSEIKYNLVSLLKKLKSEGKIVAGFGASAKGNTLLNYSGINNELLTHVFDITPEKQNKLTPVSNIPIIHQSRLMENSPDYLLLLAWNYADEIFEKTLDFKNKGGKYIIPVPEVRII